jgi:glycosyltransferase involved in cell wall biosynthesis
MRIGINALFFASGGSLTRLTTLLGEWNTLGVLDENEIIVFSGPGSRDNLTQRLGSDVAQKLEFVLLANRDRHLLSRMYLEQFRLPAEARKRAIDVLFCAGNIVPLFSKSHRVVEFQNAAPFCDSVTRRSVGLKPWLRFKLLGLTMRLSARSADRVIFISEFFRDLFVKRFHFPAAKGVVIYRAGVDEKNSGDPLTEERLGIRRPYCLSLAGINPYKHLIEVVEAFAKAREHSVDGPMQLVIAGRDDNFPAYTEQVRRRVGELGLTNDVVFTAEIAHAEGQQLIAGCSVFLFSSSCENCPTALIEALSAGVPIACSNVGVMPEIAGNAVKYFDPLDPKSIAAALIALFTDRELRDTLRSRGRERARHFPDGAAVARATLEALRTLPA